ncbi:carbonic anhydrase family protein [Enterococcus saccharolyticus]|nr:carbonic anhydrase family protein [Enterococcus saccharolyticus]OJG88535.1 carbonic anhydrase [Enterococcus saccharolyticus]
MDVEWSYSGANGPEHWHTLCDWYAEGAKYPYQSPIHLVHGDTQAIGDEVLSFHYKKEKFTEKEFKNTIHFVPYNTESYVVFKGVEYHLTDIHFHMPSEHVIDDTQTELEFHLVHTNAKQENLVVGVLFNLTDKLNWICNDQDDSIWDFDHHIQWFDPSIFLPEKHSHFHYVGSLTTPPTKGPVNWFVFDTIGEMSRLFIEEFREEVLENNNRPLQEKKDRPIYYSE